MKRAQIIKIGGSLIRSGLWLKVLDAALEQALNHDDVPIFIMGGGELADVVRQLRTAHGFSETAEHHMSLLAMEQHSIMAQALRPVLQSVQTAQQALAAICTYTPAIVCEYAHLFQHKDIDAIPSITSDSLTLWFTQQLCELAEQQSISLNCEALILKSCAVPSAIQRDAQALAAQGIADEAFPRFAQALLSATQASWSVVNAEEALCM
jgi:aspartokinase-like uncharacterized kinase